MTSGLAYTKEEFASLSDQWSRSAWCHVIHGMITWLGVPICQFSEDLVMMAELIQRVGPDIIVETGTYCGGSAVFYASMLELLGKGQVISIDIAIQDPDAIQAHPMGKRITLIEGDSLNVIGQVRALIGPDDTALVALDSDHAQAHVLAELELYSSIVNPGSYIVAFDGIMRILADVPGGSRSWANDSPAGAIEEFLAGHPEFEVDPYYNRLGITCCPKGFLRRIG